MGSLLAGALTGAGKGIQSNIEHDRLMEREDLDREHDKAMERMRAQSNQAAATTRSEHEIGMAGKQNERDLAAAELEQDRQLASAKQLREHTFGLQMNENELEVWKTNADNESDEWQVAYQGFLKSKSGTAGTKRAAGAWEVTWQDVSNDDGTYSSKMFASHPNGTTIEQVQNRMLEAGISEKDRAQGLGVPDQGPEVLHTAELRLLEQLSKGNDTSEKFLKRYKFLPTSYYRAVWEKDDEVDMQEFHETWARDRGGPEMPYGGKMPRSTPDRMDGAAAQPSGGKPPMTAADQTGALTKASNLNAQGNLDPMTKPGGMADMMLAGDPNARDKPGFVDQPDPAITAPPVDPNAPPTQRPMPTGAHLRPGSWMDKLTTPMDGIPPGDPRYRK